MIDELEYLATGKDGLGHYQCDKCRTIFEDVPKKTYQLVTKYPDGGKKKEDICQSCYDKWRL